MWLPTVDFESWRTSGSIGPIGLHGHDLQGFRDSLGAICTIYYPSTDKISQVVAKSSADYVGRLGQSNARRRKDLGISQIGLLVVSRESEAELLGLWAMCKFSGQRLQWIPREVF